MLANMASDNAYNIHGQRARQHACLCVPLCTCRAAPGEAALRLARILEEVRDDDGVRMVFASCSVNHGDKRAWSARMTARRHGSRCALGLEVQKDVGLQTTGPPHREPRSVRDVATITRTDDGYLQHSVLRSARAPSWCDELACRGWVLLVGKSARACNREARACNRGRATEAEGGCRNRRPFPKAFLEFERGLHGGRRLFDRDDRGHGDRP